jgi:hypothetical protein
MHGVDPATMGDYVEPSDDPLDTVGSSPDLGEYRRLLTSAVLSGRLKGCDPSNNVSDATHIRMTDVVPWLQEKNFTDLALRLSSGPDEGVTAQVSKKRHVYRLPVQEEVILEELRALGYVPSSLPKNTPGKAGVKKTVQVKLANHPVFSGSKTFSKAWERLRADARIANLGDAPK